MSDITREDKIAFLKVHFPNKSYSILEIATFLHCSKKTTRYWMTRYEVPTVRITGTPFVLQGNLIDFLLQSDEDHSNEDDNIGLRFCIKRKMPKRG
jgi:hypothetical protein